MNISLPKVVENSLTLVVTSVFIGACTIVWQGATTVGDKVAATENSLQHLIDNLSTKLAAYEIQLVAQSNQLAAISEQLKTSEPDVTANVVEPRTNLDPPITQIAPIESSPINNNNNNSEQRATRRQQVEQMEQRARKDDIYKSLKKNN